LDAKDVAARDSSHRSARELPAARVRLRIPPRRSVLLLLAGLMVSACTSPSAPPPTERGVRRCDRNGDYEERMACRP